MKETFMNTHLVDHIDAKIGTAANFVSKFMPVDIDIDSAYEALLAGSTMTTSHMIDAFQTAVAYLPPSNTNKYFHFDLEDGRRIARVQARLTPTTKWPAFLFPDSELVLNPEDKLAALLYTPIHVATEWESLSYVWQQLRSTGFDLDVAQLAYLMPWIRECLADFDRFGLPIDAPKIERKSIEKELATVMNDANVTFFPRMSTALKEVARSGKTLFAQYQLLDAAYTRETLTQPPLTVERTPSLIEPWLKEHMAETYEEWRNDMQARRARRAEELTIRAAKKLPKE